MIFARIGFWVLALYTLPFISKTGSGFELTGGVKLCGFLLFLEFFVFFPESLDSTRGVDKFLFAGKKRMTFGAYFITDIRFGRTDLYLIAACTSYARFIVLRMNSVFHVIYNPLLVYLIR